MQHSSQSLSSSKTLLPHASKLKILNLCLMCTHFNTAISPPTHAQLLIAEKTPWARRLGLYSCMDCVRLRAGIKFADKMKKGKKGLNGQQSHKRLCADCGMEPKEGKIRYPPGSEIVVNGRRMVNCECCKKWKGGVEVGCSGSRQCLECHQKYSYRCR